LHIFLNFLNKTNRTNLESKKWNDLQFGMEEVDSIGCVYNMWTLVRAYVIEARCYSGNTTNLDGILAITQIWMEFWQSRFNFQDGAVVVGWLTFRSTEWNNWWQIAERAEWMNKREAQKYLDFS